MGLDQCLQLVGCTIAFAALCIGVGRLWATFHPLWERWRARQILEDRLARGSYDKATIERCTRYYVRSCCANVDPAREQEFRKAAFVTADDVFDRIDEFLDDREETQRHILILADSGIGKTSFVLNYYVHNTRRPRKRRQRLVLVNLGNDDADERIAEIVDDRENTVIFLDSFDEDVKARKDHRARIGVLMEACSGFNRVLVSCRSQFFPGEEEIPRSTGVVKVAPRAGESPFYEFGKITCSHSLTRKLRPT